MLETLTTGQALAIFVLFAVVGLAEMGLVVYRIYRSSADRDRLVRLRENLEEAREENRVDEEFYREQVNVHTGESPPGDEESSGD